MVLVLQRRVLVMGPRIILRGAIPIDSNIGGSGHRPLFMRDFGSLFGPRCLFFFLSVFLLSVNLFFPMYGMHCFVNHTCTSLIMVLCCTFVYFRTVLNYFTCFAFFYLCFCSLCIPFLKFMFVHCFVGYVKTSFDKLSVLHLSDLHCMRPVCILYNNFITSKLS